MGKLIFIGLLFLAYNLNGQIATGEELPSSIYPISNFDNINTISFGINSDSLINLENSYTDTAFICGKPIHCQIDLINEGTVIFETSNFTLYQLKIQSSTARSIGIYFSQLYLPNGCKLFGFNNNKTQIIGAINTSGNRPNQKFAIQPISGDIITLEYLIPKDLTEVPLMIVDKVGHFYKDIVSILSDDVPEKSGDCYEDIHCSLNYGKERAVLKWLFFDPSDDNFYQCSGSILNQNVSANELKPYVYTANHCGKDAELETAVFYFNYNNHACDVDGSTLDYTTIGATKKASKGLFDMFLMELNQTPPPDYNIHYLGWDRDNNFDLFAFVDGIHHPEGIEKAKSEGRIVDNTNPNFWRVRWDMNDAPTAKGSSGSPLIETFYGRVIGDLSYGNTDCDNIDGVDKYGKFRKQWDATQGADERLRDWLDPDNTDANDLDGRDPCFDNILIQERFMYPALQYQPENKVTIQVNNSINTEDRVWLMNGSHYRFTAGGSIELNPGFQTLGNARFEASIAMCTAIANNHMGLINDEITESPNDLNHLQDLGESFSTNIINSIKCYPNPFKDEAIIEFSLENDEFVNLFISNVYGEIISILINNEFHEKDIHQIILNSNNLAAGTYYYTIKTPTFTETQKLILLK